MKVFYFGCWDRAGHYLFDANARTVPESGRTVPWESIDAVLCPGYVDRYNSDPQIEGEAELHHKDGWTALAFWDRSVDTRGGCNSAFFSEGTYGPEAMIQIARSHFPTIWKRFTFEVRVVSRPSDIENTKILCSICGGSGFATKLDGWTLDPPGWFRSDTRIACSVACVTKSPSVSVIYPMREEASQ